MPKDIKVDYSKLKDLTGEQILQQVKTKVLIPPTEGESKDMFLQFSRTAPGSAERTQLLTKLGTPADSAPAGQPTGDKGVSDQPPPKNEDGAAGGSPADAGGQPPAGNSVDDILKELGYKDVTELRKAHTELMKGASSLNQQLQKARASGGKVGQERDALQRKLETTESRLKEIEEKIKPKPMDRPRRPKRPDPSKFDDGILDPKYQTEASKWEVDMEAYETKVEQYANAMKPPWAQKLEEGFTQLSTQVEDVSKKTETTYQSEAQRNFNTEWDGFWGEIGKIQSQYKLQTSIPAREINEHKLIVENAEAKDEAGNPVYPKEQVEASQSFLNALKAEDKANFSKISRLAKAQYSFDNGTPRSRFKNIRAAIIENNLESDFPLLQEVQMSEADRKKALSESQRNSDSSASGMPASGVGANDDKLSAPKTNEEKAKRLQDILAIRKKNPAHFKGNPALQTEAKTLASALGLHWPG